MTTGTNPARDTAAAANRLAPIERGALVLVVGPSGAGKDTLIAHARAAVADDAIFAFPERIITRPADAGPERHRAISQDGFAAAAGRGDFCLMWRAHGQAYGIPSGMLELLKDGRVVVINVSRTVIPAAERLAAVVRVVVVQASIEVLAARIATRGRETGEAIAARLARSGAMATPERADVIDICNDGPIGCAAERLIAELRATALSVRAAAVQ